MRALDADYHLRSLIAEGRVLLAITPDGPPSTRTSWASVPMWPETAVALQRVGRSHFA
jgi:hypothetical protein